MVTQDRRSLHGLKADRWANKPSVLGDVSSISRRSARVFFELDRVLGGDWSRETPFFSGGIRGVWEVDAGAAMHWSFAACQRVLYVSGEESLNKLRCGRSVWVLGSRYSCVGENEVQLITRHALDIGRSS
ncbi:MAG: hypothetical protein CM1200mP41_32960 [Gammaproteobacteria bacterium]|nr:MAG: hypothetical protein CM1200mP41_32960 [Gammaproteobacteria bacterium]